jgi:Flp pilus assembly protein TadG
MRITNAACQQLTQRRRQGSLTVELILVLPILVIVLVAMVQFSVVLAARQQLLAASREGARVGARGGNESEITGTVRQALGSSSMADATVTCQILADDPKNAGPGRECVQVTIQVPTQRVVPGFLSWMARLVEDDLTVCTVMHRE